MGYAVAARWTAKEGREEQVFEALRGIVSPSRAEPGTQLYQLNRSQDDPRVFLLYEVYDDEAAYQEHAASERFQTEEFLSAVAELESRERSFYDSVD